jgi:glycosyltransferase involved in cell wall biosynthesis
LAEIEAENGCVVLIAAHEEAGTIGPTVAALKSQLCEWPGSRLWVVADRCHDGTAAEAKSAGAQVASRSGGRLGKGAGIAWWLEKCLNDWRANEVIVVLDADSRWNKAVCALRRAMASGADARKPSSLPMRHALGPIIWLVGVLMQHIDDEARRRWLACAAARNRDGARWLAGGTAPRLHTLAESRTDHAGRIGAHVLFAPGRWS